MGNALTDPAYWDDVWTFTEAHLAEAPRVQVDRDRHQAHLARLIRHHLPPGGRFLEIGAAGSPWPAYVARQEGDSWGIDFSRRGLAIAAACAHRDGARVSLVEGDLFDRARLPERAFDVVYSGGFVEHFPDPRPVMERLAELVTPGGAVITTVPNLDGVNGAVQRWVDADCFARHVVFTPDSLDAAHRLARLRPLVPAHFVGALDLGSVNLSRLASRLPRLALRVLWAGLYGSRRAAEALVDRLGVTHGGRLFASALVGVYRLEDA
jgi:2-polyprenyl-3-methyl-5-hydroxy-6-metoxy-1,4-benzoquinol methylase